MDQGLFCDDMCERELKLPDNEKATKIVEKWIENNDMDDPLDLSNLGLVELPYIPIGCITLRCTKNRLTKLPDLPNCERLYCSENELIMLPDLPNCELLYCAENKLIMLPDLPLCIQLDCMDNNILMLPDLPVCQQLHWFGNKYLYLTPQQCKQFNVHKVLILRDLRTPLTVNYSRFAIKIQKAYRTHKQKPVFIKLCELYIKNVSLLISQYI